MSTSKQSLARRWLEGWHERRRARRQRWVEKRAVKRTGDADQWKPGSGGGPGM